MAIWLQDLVTLQHTVRRSQKLRTLVSRGKSEEYKSSWILTKIATHRRTWSTRSDTLSRNFPRSIPSVRATLAEIVLNGAHEHTIKKKKVWRLKYNKTKYDTTGMLLNIDHLELITKKNTRSPGSAKLPQPSPSGCLHGPLCSYYTFVFFYVFTEARFCISGGATAAARR